MSFISFTGSIATQIADHPITWPLHLGCDQDTLLKFKKQASE